MQFREGTQTIIGAKDRREVTFAERSKIHVHSKSFLEHVRLRCNALLGACGIASVPRVAFCSELAIDTMRDTQGMYSSWLTSALGGKTCMLADANMGTEELLVRSRPVILHEAAHAIVSPPIPASEQDSLEETQAMSSVLAATTAPNPDWVYQKTHSASWVRGCIHLTYRAQQLGESFSINAVCPNEPLAQRAYIALESEAAEMIDWPVERIMATEPPAAFTELMAIREAEQTKTEEVTQ